MRPRSDIPKDLDCAIDLVNCVLSTIRGTMKTTGAPVPSEPGNIRRQLTDQDVSMLQHFAARVRELPPDEKLRQQHEDALSAEVNQYVNTLAERLA